MKKAILITTGLVLALLGLAGLTATTTSTPKIIWDLKDFWKITPSNAEWKVRK